MRNLSTQTRTGTKFFSKTKKEQIEWRRTKILELSSQGFNQSEICQTLQLDKSAVNRDIQFLRRQAQENLQKLNHETIPDEHQRCLEGITQVLKIVWGMINSGNIDKAKLQALALINDCNKYKMDLATGAICNEAINFVTQRKEQLEKLDRVQKIDKRLEKMKEEREEEEDKTTSGIF